MSKHSTDFESPLSRVISFLDFWILIGNQLGDAKLRINPEAGNIHQLMDRSSDHTQQLRDVIIKSYKKSHCYHLRSPINLIAVLDILGETAYEMYGNQAADLLDIEMLEEIAWCISERFGSLIKSQIDADEKNISRDSSLERERRTALDRKSETSRHNRKIIGHRDKTHAGKTIGAQIVSLPAVKIRRANRKP